MTTDSKEDYDVEESCNEICEKNKINYSKRRDGKFTDYEAIKGVELLPLLHKELLVFLEQKRPNGFYALEIINPENKAKYYLEINYDGNKEEEEEEIKDLSNKEKIILPGLGKLVSTFAGEVVEIIKDKNILFFRPESREIIEIGKIQQQKENNKKYYTGFISVKPNRFITLIERFIEPGIFINKKENWGAFKHKSMSGDISNTLLQSHILQESLPLIERIFTIPLPIVYKGKLTFPKNEYDSRFNSWLPNDAPKIENSNMELKEAKGIIQKIFSEFCFEDRQDYINAIASLITPSLRGLFSEFNVRTPITIYLANRERAGKDYLAGITGIVYEGQALEEPPISSSEFKSGGSSDELRKKFLSALIDGRKRLHFSNNKGFVNNSIFESFITSTHHSDRVLGVNKMVTFENEMDFSMSGNIGIGFTPDFANRGRFVRLSLDIEDANSRKFKNPQLHKWVKNNRGLILSAIFSLVRNWVEKGSPDGKVPFTSFPEWAKICGGIMECAGYENPCNPDKKGLILGGDIETQNMKRLFEVCFEKHKEAWINKTQILSEIRNNDDLFNYLDFENRPGQVKFGNMLIRFNNRVLSGIRMVVKDLRIRSARREYKFTKEKRKKDKSLIFREDGNVGNLFGSNKLKNGEKGGNLGNLGNLSIPTHRELKTVYIGQYEKIAKVTNITKQKIPVKKELTEKQEFRCLEDINDLAILKDGEPTNLNPKKDQIYKKSVLGDSADNIFQILLDDKKIERILPNKEKVVEPIDDSQIEEEFIKEINEN